MQTLTYQHSIDVPADAAWNVLADFGAFLDWAGSPGASIEVSGAGMGMIRHLTIEGYGTIGERLDTLDPDTRTLAYTLVEGQPLGMTTYQARLTVTPTSASACRLDWSGRFEGEDETAIKPQLRGSWQGMSAALESFARNAG